MFSWHSWKNRILFVLSYNIIMMNNCLASLSVIKKLGTGIIILEKNKYIVSSRECANILQYSSLCIGGVMFQTKYWMACLKSRVSNMLGDCPATRILTTIWVYFSILFHKCYLALPTGSKWTTAHWRDNQWRPFHSKSLLTNRETNIIGTGPG